MKTIKNIYKNTFEKRPYSARMFLGLVMIAVAFMLTGLLENLIALKQYFPFTGLIMLIIVTWLLYKTDNKNLDELGFNLKPGNVSFLFLGLLIGAVAFVLVKYLRFLYTGESLEMNLTFEWSLVLLGLYYVLPMVAIEEFLFRGYLFKKTIEVSGVALANLVFAVIFMLVHVLDKDAMSSTGMIIFLVISIPVAHMLFATALLKSKTILFPIGLHWGNNWASFHLITDMQKQDSILFVSDSATFTTWASFITFILIWNGFYLFLTYLIWKWPEGREKIR